MGKFGPKSESCVYVLWACNIIEKSQNCSRMILISTLVFWISNPKSIFWEIWYENSKLFVLLKNWHTRTHTHTHIQRKYLEDSDSYSEISFLKFQIYIHFLGKFEVKKFEFFTLPGSCYTKYLEDIIVRIQRKMWKQI